MAGSKKDTLENALLLLLFNNTNIANVGDATGVRGSTSAGSFYVALYTGAPSDSAQGTECNYTGYARKAVARTAGGWTVSGNQVSNTALVTFDPCTGGTNNVTHYAICKAGTAGVDDAIYWADLTQSLTVTNGITPEFAIGQIAVTED